MVKLFEATDPDKGYNMRQGGKHNTPCSEVGQHISQAKLGHEVSAETRSKLRMYGRKRVVQKQLDGTIIEIFDSVTDAARAMNTDKAVISAACRGKTKTCKNYCWEFYDDKEVV